MSISGKARFVFAPYKTKENDGIHNFYALEHIIKELHAKEPFFSCGTMRIPKIPNNPSDERDALVVDVNDNVNFRFQLTQIPKMLIPNFWSMPEDEVEKKRMELISNDAWMLENLKKLALQINGSVTCIESYDSFAEGEYAYNISPSQINANETDVIIAGKRPDYCNALRKQFAMVKQLVDRFKGTMNMANYYGLYK